MRNNSTKAHNRDDKGIRANVPMRHYDPEDRIIITQPVRRPTSTRPAIEGVSVPVPGEDFQALNS